MVEMLWRNTSPECEIARSSLQSALEASSVNIGENQAMYHPPLLHGDLVQQAWNHGSHPSLSYITGYISEAAKFCSGACVCVCVRACLFVGVRSVCRCLCMCCAETHLSSVAHADECAHWLESTRSTGQEVGAVVGLQETNKVGALRLPDTETFVKASITKETQQKKHFICLTCHFFTICKSDNITKTKCS